MYGATVEQYSSDCWEWPPHHKHTRPAGGLGSGSSETITQIGTFIIRI